MILYSKLCFSDFNFYKIPKASHEQARVVKKTRKASLKSALDVYNAFIGYLEVNPKNNITKQNVEEDFLKNIEGNSFIDSCNKLNDIGYDLKLKFKYYEALELLGFLHTLLNKNEVLYKVEKFALLARVKINIGRIYAENAIWIKALDILNEALHISKMYNNNAEVGCALHYIGSLYFQKKDYSLAKEYINSSIKINQKYGFKEALLWNYNSIAAIYSHQDNNLAALDYYNKAINELRQEDKKPLNTLYINLSDLYIKTGDLELAKYYSELPVVNDWELGKLTALNLNKLEIYRQLDKTDSCNKYLKNAFNLLERTDNPRLAHILLKHLYEYYEKINKPQIALKYAKQFIELRDSIEQVNNNLSYDKFSIISNIYEKDLENKLQEGQLIYENKSIKQKIAWSIIISCILFIAFVLIILLFRSRKREIKALILNSEINKKLAENEKQAMIQNENELTKEIDYKNRQLTSSTLQLARNNQFILKTIKELQNILYTFKSHENSKRIKINELINELRHYISNNNWEEFRLFFEEVHPSFYDNLGKKHPILTQNELKFCALIKLGLNNKELASILYREVRSIESARNRLRKKFQLKTNQSLFGFLSDF